MKLKMNLPVVNPIVASNTEHGYLLSGVQANIYSKSWIMGNYVNQIYYSLTLGPDMNFYPMMNHCYCPCIDYLRISRDLISKKWDSIIDFLIESIQSQYYIHIFFDQYFIPQSKAYGKSHSLHPTLVYGYNKLSKQFSVADFYQNRKFIFTEVSFHNIVESYSNLLNVKMPFINERYFGSYDAILYKNKKDFNYQFSVDLLSKSFEYYLDSSNLSKLSYQQDYFYFRDATFGINTLIKTYEFLKHENNCELINYKFFTVPCERTRLMLERLDYLYENKYLGLVNSLSDAFSEIENIYKQLINLSIKYNIKNDNNIKDRILNKILNVFEKEKIAFYELINSLK